MGLIQQGEGCPLLSSGSGSALRGARVSPPLFLATERDWCVCAELRAPWKQHSHHPSGAAAGWRGVHLQPDRVEGWPEGGGHQPDGGCHLPLALARESGAVGLHWGWGGGGLPPAESTKHPLEVFCLSTSRSCLFSSKLLLLIQILFNKTFCFSIISSEP